MHRSLPLLLAALWLSASGVQAAPAPVPGRAVAPRGELAPDEKANIELFQRSNKSVCFVTNIVVRQDVFSLNVMEIPQGAGSCFVWDDKGHIVTNFHVIQ
ncbi:MAG: HtrA2 peptidase, partial [Elusimicrobia bacterium]